MFDGPYFIILIACGSCSISFFLVPSSEETSFCPPSVWCIFQSSLHITNHSGPPVWAVIHVLHSRRFLYQLTSRLFIINPQKDPAFCIGNCYIAFWLLNDWWTITRQRFKPTVAEGRLLSVHTLYHQATTAGLQYKFWNLVLKKSLHLSWVTLDYSGKIIGILQGSQKMTPRWAKGPKKMAARICST